MLGYEALISDLQEIDEGIEELKSALNIEDTLNQISELESLAQEPDFWTDSENAQKIQTKLSHLQKKIDTYKEIKKETENLLVLCQLGDEAEDSEILQEVKDGLEKLRQEYDSIKLQTLFTGEYDANNAILTLHSGAGGTEAQDWAEMLYRMYSRWAEKKEFSLKTLNYLEGDEAGIKTVSFMLTGENAYGLMKSEMGVHRLVRISPFDSSGRRHTSFASLEVIPEIDDSIKIDIKSDDLRVDTYRSSGAGGQHVNKTDSAIRITHLPTGVVVSCQSERSQIQNRETAMNMLKSKLFALAREAHIDRIEDFKGDQMDIAWGSQIRSYVFCPYTMVKDHRTNYETGDIQSVMDGDLDGFINAFLSAETSN